jgi:serpin B
MAEKTDRTGSGKSSGQNERRNQLARVLLTGLLLCATIAGSHFWYQSHKMPSCDRAAQGDAQRLAAAVERFYQEAAELGCPQPEITQKFVPFFVGPYYGWSGTSRRCKVRVRVQENAVQACAVKGSTPDGGDSRHIYRVDLATLQGLPSTIGPCYGQEYGGAQAPCYISSLLNSNCSLPWTRKKRSEDEAARVSECEKTKEKNKERKKAFEALARTSLNRLGVELYGKLVSDDANLVFSPAGLFIPLAMAYAGAGGQTKAEMEKVMGIDPSNTEFHATLGALAEELECAVLVGDGQLNVDSVAVGDKEHPFRKEYKDFIRSHYGVELDLATFGNREAGPPASASEKVKRQKELINRTLAGKQHPDAKLILANEVYFKGIWKPEFKFDEKNTREAPFFFLDGKHTDVPTMSAHQKPFKYMEGKNFQGLEMMYEGGEVSMVIFLPREKKGLPHLEKQLTIDNITRWLEKLETWTYGVDVYLPKFLMTWNLDLIEPLERLGMKQASSRNADFTRMSVGRGPLIDLYISGFTQKGWLEVNEEGTEAFAQSTLCMNITGSDGDPPPKPEPKIFRADHPFLFLVRHNPTNCLIFLGRMTAPF